MSLTVWMISRDPGLCFNFQLQLSPSYDIHGLQAPDVAIALPGSAGVLGVWNGRRIPIQPRCLLRSISFLPFLEKVYHFVQSTCSAWLSRQDIPQWKVSLLDKRISYVASFRVSGWLNLLALGILPSGTFQW